MRLNSRPNHKPQEELNERVPFNQATDGIQNNINKQIQDLYNAKNSEKLNEEIELNESDYQEIFNHLGELYGKESPEHQAYIDSISHAVLKLLEENPENISTEDILLFLNQQKERLDTLPEKEKAIIQAQINSINNNHSNNPSISKEIISNTIDLIPIIGSCKMIAEATKGNTLSGEKLPKKKRVTHLLLGAGCLLVDIGTLGSGGVVIKGLSKGGKIAKGIKRVGAICRVTKGLKSISKPIFKIGGLLAKNPKITNTLIKHIEAKKKIKLRNLINNYKNNN